MADEKKTYLVNIESNLKQYAEEAAEAKKRVDELTVANMKLQASDTATAAEKEAGLAALKNANDEYRKAASLVKTAIAANSSEVGSRKQLGETLKLQMQALGKLGGAYVTNAKGQKELNPLYIEQRRQIAATKQAILDYDRSLNDGRSNIGRYGESVKAAFGDVKKNLLGMLAPAALITAGITAIGIALGKLKEAFKATETGEKFFNKLGESLRTFATDIVKFNIKGLFSSERTKEVKDYADAMNEIRIGDRKDLIEIAKMETDIKLLRLQSEKAITGSKEQLNLLLQAEQKENDLMDYKIKDKEEELRVVQRGLKIREDDTTLLGRQAQLEADIINIRGEKSLRIASKIRTIKEKDGKDDIKIIEDQKKILEDFEKYSDNLAKKRRTEKEKAGVDEMKRLEEEYQAKVELLKIDEEAGFEAQKIKARDNVDALQTILDLEYGALLASVDYTRMTNGEKLLADQQYTEATRQFSLIRMDQQLKEYDAIASLVGSMSDLFGRQTAAAKTLSVAQALISTYTAGVKAMAELPLGSGPVLRFLTLASVIAAGLVQVKNILAVNVPGGGSANMPTAITASSATQRVFANQAGSTVLTQPQLSQSQLNAIPNQNLLTADQIINALKNMPNPVVTVEDINRVSIAKKKVEVRAII